jgi:hypothetical protein
LAASKIGGGESGAKPLNSARRHSVHLTLFLNLPCNDEASNLLSLADSELEEVQGPARMRISQVALDCYTNFSTPI